MFIINVLLRHLPGFYFSAPARLFHLTRVPLSLLPVVFTPSRFSFPLFLIRYALQLFLPLSTCAFLDSDPHGKASNEQLWPRAQKLRSSALEFFLPRENSAWQGSELVTHHFLIKWLIYRPIGPRLVKKLRGEISLHFRWNALASYSIFDRAFECTRIFTELGCLMDRKAFVPWLFLRTRTLLLAVSIKLYCSCFSQL